ncbi:MAG: tetratricopeptide repeat protein [Polyangiaceae bacterium]
MQDRDPPAPPSSREVAGEDFLFHLYRGSELLQDNRVHDAKAELEQALRFQPSDPKGQDLLGIVYFRLGLYPRAIAIYEHLVQTHPDAIEPRVNLALSYLKTGQAQSARFELERVVEQNPHHSRAWGYLGLAFQRLGDYERASHAFAAGGHDVMARRLLDMAMQSSPNATVTAPASLLPDPSSRESRRPPSFEARSSLSIRPGIEAFRDPVASLSRPPPPETTASTWTPIDADEGARSPSPPPSIEASAPPIERTPPAPPVQMVPPPAALPTGASLGTSTMAPPSSRATLSERPRASAPTPMAQAFREALLVFPRALPVAQHPSGLVLVQAANGFAVRLDVVRSMTLGAPAGDPLPRRVRGRVVEEPLGGAASPLLAMPPKSELCLAPQEEQRLLVIALADEPLYLREDALAGLELDVAYENGRLPVGDGEAIPMVQLKGPGSVVASVPQPCHAVEVMDGRNLTVRAAHVVAWTGRLLPRALLASEAPAGAHHLCTFTGEGMVLLDGRR